MLTGIEHIREERIEQINKHGWDIEHDNCYFNGELIEAALFCLDPNTFPWPKDWMEEFRLKILAKDRVNQLRVAGAFFLAEEDRIKQAGRYGLIISKIANQIDALQFIKQITR